MDASGLLPCLIFFGLLEILGNILILSKKEQRVALKLPFIDWCSFAILKLDSAIFYGVLQAFVAHGKIADVYTAVLAEGALKLLIEFCILAKIILEAF